MAYVLLSESTSDTNNPFRTLPPFFRNIKLHLQEKVQNGKNTQSAGLATGRKANEAELTDSRSTKVGWMVRVMRTDSGLSRRRERRWTAARPMATVSTNEIAAQQFRDFGGVVILIHRKRSKEQVDPVFTASIFDANHDFDLFFHDATFLYCF
jgi:hypothetical protein